MRKLAVSAALFAIMAGSVSPLHAEETADLYSKNGVNGPSFARATQCAATYSLTSGLLPEGSKEYQNTVKVGTAWLMWAYQVAEGRNADQELTSKIDAFKARTANLDNDGYNAEVAKDIQACNSVRDLMSSLEPFRTVYNDVIQGTTNGAATAAPSNMPDIDVAMDCVAANDFAVGIVGKDTADSAPYEAAYQGWSKYVRAIFNGSGGDMENTYEARAKSLGDYYDELEAKTSGSGLDQLSADVTTCKNLSKSLNDYF